MKLRCYYEVRLQLNPEKFFPFILPVMIMIDQPAFHMLIIPNSTTLVAYTCCSWYISPVTLCIHQMTNIFITNVLVEKQRHGIILRHRHFSNWLPFTIRMYIFMDRQRK